MIILGWIIAGAVLIVLLLLLLFNVTVIFDFNGDIYLRISYLCFTIVKIPAIKKKNRKRKRRAKKALKSVAKVTETVSVDEVESENGTDGSKKKASAKSVKPEKPDEKKPAKQLSLGEMFEVVKLVLDSLGKPLKKLLKRTKVSHLRLGIVCGGDDAAKAALNFGRMNIIVGNALGWIDSFFTLKSVDELHIDVDFESERTTANAYCEARLTLIAALAFVFTLLGRAIRFYLSHGEAKSAVDKFIKK